MNRTEKFDAWLDGEVAKMGYMTPGEEARFRRAMSATMAAELHRLDDLVDQVVWPFRLIARRRLRRARARVTAWMDR